MSGDNDIRDKLRQAETSRSIVQYSFTPRKPEGLLGRTAQDGHLDSHWHSSSTDETEVGR